MSQDFVVSDIKGSRRRRVLLQSADFNAAPDLLAQQLATAASWTRWPYFVRMGAGMPADNPSEGRLGDSTYQRLAISGRLNIHTQYSHKVYYGISYLLAIREA